MKSSVVARLGVKGEGKMNRQSTEDFYDSEDTLRGIIIKGFGKCHLYIGPKA